MLEQHRVGDKGARGPDKAAGRREHGAGIAGSEGWGGGASAPRQAGSCGSGWRCDAPLQDVLPCRDLQAGSVFAPGSNSSRSCCSIPGPSSPCSHSHPSPPHSLSPTYDSSHNILGLSPPQKSMARLLDLSLDDPAMAALYPQMPLVSLQRAGLGPPSLPAPARGPWHAAPCTAFEVPSAALPVQKVPVR